jgi:hypothetical protein
MLLTPVPLEFLVGRVQGCLYIPLAAWAVFAAVVLFDIARWASGFLADEPLFRYIGNQKLFALVLVGAVCFWILQNLHLRASLVTRAAAQEGAQTWDVIQQLRSLDPHARPYSRVVFLDDPFTDQDMSLIATLWFRDPTVQIYNNRHQHLSSLEIASMDNIFQFQNGKLVQLK